MKNFIYLLVVLFVAFSFVLPASTAVPTSLSGTSSTMLLNPVVSAQDSSRIKEYKRLRPTQVLERPARRKGAGDYKSPLAGKRKAGRCYNMISRVGK